MPIFNIRRVLGDLSKDDIDAAAFRAIVCSYEYPGMRWHQSYWDVEKKELNCIYEADNAAQIFVHSERSRIPCDEVREVTVIRPGDYLLGGEPSARPVTVAVG